MLPKIYPPMSEKIQPNKNINKNIFNSKKIEKYRKKIEKIET
tara:strand:- start:327 stop:452 length:126 start_codon:yes stop_codon:yes gene_type:complete